MTAKEIKRVLNAVTGTPDWNAFESGKQTVIMRETYFPNIHNINKKLYKDLKKYIKEQLVIETYFSKKEIRKFADVQFRKVEKDIDEYNFPLKLKKKNLALGNFEFYTKLNEVYSANTHNGFISKFEFDASGMKSAFRLPNIQKIKRLPKKLKRVAMKALVDIYIKGEFIELD